MKITLHHLGKAMRRLANGLAAFLLCAAVGLLPGLPAQAFHFPWDQGHDTTDWDDPDNPGPCEGPNCDPCKSTGSPVYIPTGHMIWTETDVGFSGRPPISISRTFNSNDPRTGVFGNGWTSGCEVKLIPVASAVSNPSTGASQIVTDYVLTYANGKRYVYEADRSTIPVPPGAPIISPPGRFDRVVPRSDGSADLIDESGAAMSFDTDGNLMASSEPTGQTLNYLYDSRGLLVRLEDSSGRFLDITYNTQGFISFITDHDGRTWSYAYDTDGNLVSVDDPAGGLRAYTYQPYSPVGDGHVYQQLTSIADGEGVVVSSFTYINDRVVTHTRGQNTQSYSYNDSARRVTRSDSVGSQWVFTYSDDQVVTSVRDPRGVVETFQYNGDGRLQQYTDAAGSTWSASYDSLGRRLSVTNPLNDTSTRTYANDSPRPVALASAGGRTSTMSYDGVGNLTRMTDPSGSVSTMSWSASGEVTGITNPLNAQIGVSYNSIGLVQNTTDALGRATGFSYDSVGNMVAISNAVGDRHEFSYDSLNRLVGITNANGDSITYTRDNAGRISTMVDPAGNNISNQWDQFGRLASRTFGDGRTISYARRADNLISSVTAPGGMTTSYQYDAAKNVTRIDAGGEITTFTYDANSRLVRASNATGTVDIAYDSLGRIVSESTNGIAVTYQYDTEGQRAAMVSPVGTTSYGYDSRGLITRISAPEGDYDFSYDALGRRIRVSYPNGVESTWGYNAADQLVSLDYSGAYSAALSLSYGQDGLISNVAGDGADWSYQYDASGALTQAVHGADTFNYVYDDAGNHVGEGQIVDSANRQTQDAQFSYSYDQRGNLVSKVANDGSSRVDYAWNNYNKLIRYATFSSTVPGATPDRVINYSYGPLGRLWSRDDNGAVERYVYDFSDRILTLDTAGNVVETVTHGTSADEPLSISNAQGRRFVHAGYDGSVRALTDGSAVTDQYAYDPFGRSASASGSFDNDYRYTGRRHEADDLYYYRSRFYDPTTRRFLSEDPAGFVAGELNLYRYVGNNPVNFADPSGEIWPAVVIVWGAVEVGLAIYDAYDTYRTITDPCTGTWEKVFAGTVFVAGAALPGGGYSKADDVARAADNYIDDVVDIADEGVIYRVPGSATESGKPYVGRTDDLNARARNARDGRDRTQAEVIDTYPKGDTDAARAAEQRAINENGGVPNLDNKRNEIAPSKWGDFGID